MADTKPSTNHYRLLGGVNTKASEYSEGAAQFYDLRNLDFQVPNALQKRPGSTRAVSAATSGPITSLYEFEKLDGASYIVAGSDTAMFYLAANAYTLMESGWNNGQPTDLVTFVNTLWMANGQKIKKWDGVSIQPYGLPYVPGFGATALGASFDTGTGASVWSVYGVTHAPFGASTPIVAFFLACSYVREDGFYGPCDPQLNSLQLNREIPQTSINLATFAISGLTTPSGYGISAIAIWIAMERAYNNDYRLQSTPKPNSITPGLVWGGARVADTAELREFRLFTLMPAGTATFLLTFPNGFSTFYEDNSFRSFDIDTFSFRNIHYTFNGVNEFSMVPKYLEINQNMMFMAGFSAGPSEVWFSDVGDPESVEPDYNFEVRTNDGDKVTAIKPYMNQLIIMKERSFHKVYGNEADNLELVEVTTQYGCLSNKTVVEFKEKLAWLDKRGILEFNGSTWDIISTPVEDVFRRMNLNAAREKACAVNFSYRNQIWFGIPVDGSTQNNITVVYDYLVGAWTFFDGFNPSSFGFIKGSLDTQTAWRGDYSGNIHYFHESFFADNGAGITCLAFTSFDKAQENETWMWRRLFLDVAPESGATGTVNVQLFSNYNRSIVRHTLAIHQDQFQTRGDFGVGGKAVAARFSHHSASLPLLINGYSWTKKYLRNV